MKKAIIISLILFISVGFTFSQNEVDALRYSQSYLTGTARYVSMGGAFGALGGNFSAISTNPGGIGVFRSSEFSITPNFSYNLSSSDINGNLYEDFKYNFELSNMSIVGTIKSKSENGWKSTSFGFGYNKTNDFNMNLAIKNHNAKSSLLDDWTSDANNNNWLNMGNSLGQQANLIFQDGTSTTPQQWLSDLTNSDYGQYQSRTISTSGSAGEYTFVLGANYDNMVYLGGSLSINTVRYKETVNHNETNFPEDIDYINSFNYRTSLETVGTGTGLKLGAIVKPIDWVRIGLAIHSPIFYNLRDTYSASIDASLSLDNGDTLTSASMNGGYDYSIVTPFKAISSMAFTINKFAIISIDYEYVDYTKARLRDGGEDANSYDFDFENSNIQSVYTTTSNIKGGVEFRFGPLSLRGGYAYYGSPYAEGELNEDADYTVYSAGFGINNNNLYFDLGYSHMSNNQNYVMYPNAEGTAIANTEFSNNQLLATIGLRF